MYLLLLLQPPSRVEARRGQDLGHQGPDLQGQGRQDQGHLCLDLPSEVETIRSYNRFAQKIRNPCGWSKQTVMKKGPGAVQARPQDNPGIWEMIRNLLEQTNNLYQTNQDAKKTLSKAQVADQETNSESNEYIENTEETEDSKVRFTNSLKKNLKIAIKDLDYYVAEAAKVAVSSERTSLI